MVRNGNQSTRHSSAHQANRADIPKLSYDFGTASDLVSRLHNSALLAMNFGCPMVSILRPAKRQNYTVKV
jgi:hypothetical protein